MRQETVFFSIHFNTQGAHPKQAVDNHIVGYATATDYLDEPGLDIQIEKMYIGTGKKQGDSASGYEEFDGTDREFLKSRLYKDVVLDIEDRFGTPKSNVRDAKNICHFWSKIVKQ